MARPKRKKPEAKAPKAEVEEVKAEVETAPEAEAPKAEVKGSGGDDEPEGFDPKAAYVVANGRCIACRKGILKHGDAAESKDFGGGEVSMIQHFENGGLEKAK